MIALALVQPWGRSIPRWLLLTAASSHGSGLAMYGGLGIIVDGLCVAGIIPGSDRSAVLWSPLLWAPWWLFGEVLFIAAIRIFRRVSTDHQPFTP